MPLVLLLPAQQAQMHRNRLVNLRDGLSLGREAVHLPELHPDAETRLVVQGQAVRVNVLDLLQFPHHTRIITLSDHSEKKNHPQKESRKVVIDC
eukprot:COSAG05_NODE_407_length_10145_cov_234.042604_8_plen_94_part_00